VAVKARIVLGLGIAMAIAAACEDDPAPLVDAGAVDATTIDAMPQDAGARCPGIDSGAGRALRILLLTKETLFVHAAAHEAGDIAVPAYLRSKGHEATVSNDSSFFAGDALLPFDVVVFFVTSGNVMKEPDQRAAFERYVHAGRGIVGVHTATATDNDWPFMNQVMGAVFAGHGRGDAQVAEGRIDLAEPTNPLWSSLPNPWTRADEWYYYGTNPALNPALHPVLLLDESSMERYRPDYPDAGFYGDAGHPLAWTQEFECSRVFYSSLGHTGESYGEPAMLELLRTGIEWSAHATP
jgi:type 1 glutamine amidotransferase